MKLIKKTTAETSKPTLWKHAKIQNEIKLKLNRVWCAELRLTVDDGDDAHQQEDTKDLQTCQQ